MPKRDYAFRKSHNYKAPRRYIERDKLKGERVKKRVKALFSFFILIGFFSSLVYWLFFSPLFRLTTIIVEDQNGYSHKELKELIEAELNKKFFNSVPYRNYFLLSEADLIQTIENANVYPSIRDVAVAKQWRNKLEIRFNKRSPKLWVVTFNAKPLLQRKEDINLQKSTAAANAFESIEDDAGEPLILEPVENKPPLETEEQVVLKKYIIDEQGIVIDDKWGATLAKPPIVHIITNQIFTIGSNLIEQGKMGALFQLYQSLETHKKELGEVDYFKLQPWADNEIQVRMKNNFWVYITLEYSLQKQINYVLLVFKNIEKNKLSNVQYIDMRIENRAYICCNF